MQSLNYIQREIDKVYQELDKEKAFAKNAEDIWYWRCERIITHGEYLTLLKYNREKLDM